MSTKEQDAMNERSERGKEIIESQQATGDPGTPQPKERQERDLKSVAQDIEKIQEQTGAETRGPSATRGASGNHPVPPEERSPAYAGDQVTSQANAAAGHLSAARTALDAQLVGDARLKSDPRYERDQKVFELGRTGKLGLVPPSEAEQLAMAERSGLSKEVQEAIPHSPEEQVEKDMERLEKAEERAASMTINPTAEETTEDGPKRSPQYDEKGQIKPGQQESEKDQSSHNELTSEGDEKSEDDKDSTYGGTVIR